MVDYKPHPYADAIPFYENQFADLKSDISKNGLLDDIVLYRGQVLDGRRRLRACKELGLEPRFTTFEGSATDALKFVISKNMKRRHMGGKDFEMTAARLAGLLPGQHAKSANSIPFLSAPQTCGADKKGIESPVISESKSRAEVSEATGIPLRRLEQVSVVEKRGTEELKQAFLDETLSTLDAEKLAREEPKVQREAIKKVRSGKAKTASQAVADRKEKENGKPIWGSKNDAYIEDLYGKLIREFDNRANAYGKGRHHKECLDAMGVLLDKFTAWREAGQ